MINFDASVIQKKNSYEFNINASGLKYEIFYSNNRDFDNMKLLIKDSSSKINVPAPESGRLFFKVVTDNAKEKNISSRLVEGAGIVNLRDLGGYPTRNDKYVKWGKFYRGASLDKLGTEHQKYISDMGVKTIFDFRSKPEVEAKPDKVPSGVEYINRSGIVTMDHLSDVFNSHKEKTPEKGNLDMTGLILHYNDNPEMLDQLDGYLLNSYITMANHSEAFKDMFSSILSNIGKPMLFHCTAGKDRTGIAAALILEVLGVPRNIIMEDYLLTNTYRKAENDAVIDKISHHIKNPKILKMALDILEAKPEYLEKTFSTIEANCGSVENFFIKNLNLAKSDIDIIREECLDDFS